MENDGITKAPKDKHCPYCGQTFTSSSLGRHLDLYIKNKNPKAPDGLHNVDEIRKLRGSITRRQPRGGVRRDGSAPRDSQAGSKRSCGTSDGDSIMVLSPEDGNIGMDAMRSRSNSQRVFNRQMMKSSLDVKQRVQDAIDTAKAAELALREMMGSWRAAKQSDAKATPFDFNPLSMDFPALCLQCLESPPTLYSSTPHSTSTSWSITPPGDKQNEALKIYFGEEFRKWNSSGPTKASPSMDGLPYSPSQAGIQDDKAHNAEDAADNLEKQVTEHLEESFQVWNLLPSQRQQELWILEMARSIDKRRKEVTNLQEASHSLKQENSNLKSQIDHLNKFQKSGELSIQSPRMTKVDEKMAELWHEAGVSGRSRSGSEDRRDLNTMVSGAIERWKTVIVSSRAATASAQRSLDDASAPLKTPTSVTNPGSPDYSRSVRHHHYQQAGGRAQFRPRSSTNPISARNASSSSPGRTGTGSETKTSAASTPAQSLDDSDEDADADADVEMENGHQYLPTGNTSTHHAIPQMAQHAVQQQQQQQQQQHHMLPVSRAHEAHVSAVRHSPYPPRGSPYEAHSLLPSQQMHMTPEVFGHHMQSLEHHLAQQGHAGMGWNSH